MSCVNLLRRPLVQFIMVKKQCTSMIGRFEGCRFNQRLINQRYLSANAVVNAERKYSEKHEWVSLDGEIGTVGISHYAQEALGEIVYCQLPQVGDKFSKGEEVGAVESVKAASEVYTPVSGEIVERNEKAEESPKLINESCYEKGWLYKLRLSNPGELEKLMSETVYQDFLKKQSHD